MRKRDSEPTWIDLVQKVFPGMSKEDCNAVLWNATAFPCCGLWHTFKQLREHRSAGRTTADAMIGFAEAEMSAAMAEHSRQHQEEE